MFDFWNCFISDCNDKPICLISKEIIIVLGCRFDDFGVLVKLGSNGHVSVLITNGYDHAANDAWIDFVVNNAFFSFLHEFTNCSFNFLLHGTIDSLKLKNCRKLLDTFVKDTKFSVYLGSSDFTNNLSSVSGHDCAEGSGNSFGQVESAIFGQCQEKVLAQLIHF